MSLHKYHFAENRVNIQFLVELFQLLDLDKSHHPAIVSHSISSRFFALSLTNGKHFQSGQIHISFSATLHDGKYRSKQKKITTTQLCWDPNMKTVVVYQAQKPQHLVESQSHFPPKNDHTVTLKLGNTYYNSLPNLNFQAHNSPLGGSSQNSSAVCILVSKSPKWGCSPSKWPKWLIKGGWS